MTMQGPFETGADNDQTWVHPDHVVMFTESGLGADCTLHLTSGKRFTYDVVENEDVHESLMRAMFPAAPPVD
jgi:hypothetical protein